MAARGNAEAIAALFKVAAKCMREGKPLPPIVADYLATALEVAAAKPKNNRLKMLGQELGLLFGNRWPSDVDPEAVRMSYIWSRTFGGEKVGDAIADVVDKFGISEASVKRLLTKEDRDSIRKFAALLKKQDQKH